MAVPYCGPAPAPSELLKAWNLDPILLMVIGAAAWLLRGEPPRVKAGLTVLVVAYITPICALSAGLFSARSVHHLLIVFGAAPLLASAVRGRGAPLQIALLLHVAIFWAWHVPALYSWALSSDAAYWLGQAALTVSSILFWHSLARRDTSALAAFFALVAMVMQMGLLGALITFAPEALYTPHYLTTQQYGLSAIEDQQLAGLLMWVGSLPLAVVAGWAALYRAFRRLEGEAQA